jgi:two-component system response regulator NreC
MLSHSRPRTVSWVRQSKSLDSPQGDPGILPPSDTQSHMSGTVPQPREEPPIRIVIADDHPVVRRGLRQLLEFEQGFEIVAEAGDLDSTRRYVRGHKPDVLVLDLNMPGGSALDAMPSILASSPGMAIVVLTMQDEPAYARAALGAGALGYVLKEAADAELVQAVRAAAAGESYLNPRLGAKIAATPPGPPDGLSTREAEVLRMVALGHTNAQIAQSLYLSVRTVESHRAHIQQKLRLSDRAELVRYALEHGLLEIRDPA